MKNTPKSRDIVVKWQTIGKSSEFVISDETDKYLFNCGMPVAIPKNLTGGSIVSDRVVFVRYAEEGR